LIEKRPGETLLSVEERRFSEDEFREAAEEAMRRFPPPPIALGGRPTPEKAALQGFNPHANATVVNVTFHGSDRATVTVGFGEDEPTLGIPTLRRDDGWYAGG
jgi:hypothetical protein